jgi:hypothetical protein
MKDRRSVEGNFQMMRKEIDYERLQSKVAGEMGFELAPIVDIAGAGARPLILIVLRCRNLHVVLFVVEVCRSRWRRFALA